MVGRLQLPTPQIPILAQPRTDIAAVTSHPVDLGADSVQTLFDGAVEALYFISIVLVWEMIWEMIWEDDMGG